MPLRFFLSKPAKSYKGLYFFSSNDEALQFLQENDQLCLVRRGGLRTLKMKCPDKCGDIITVNLDPKVGKSWRVLIKNDALSVSPSVWRMNACGAHFSIRNSKVYLFGKRKAKPDR